MNTVKISGKEDINRIKIDYVHMLLSCNEEETKSTRVFECKPCKRKFSSFQALGGHRASHKKLRLFAGNNQSSVTNYKPKQHECSICGQRFMIGQALGGHMRRHRVSSVGVGHETVYNNSIKKGFLLFDLNLPAGDDEGQLELELGLGLGAIYKFADKNPKECTFQ